MSKNKFLAISAISSVLALQNANSAPLPTQSTDAVLSGAQAISTLNIALGTNAILQDRIDRTQLNRTNFSNNLWVTPYARFGTQNGNDSVEGFKEKTTGISFGLDKKLDSQTLVGAAIDMAQTTTKSRGTIDESSDTGSYSASVYAKKLFGQNYELNSIATYAIDKYTSKRLSESTYATGNYTGWHSMISAELLRHFKIDSKQTISPLFKIYGAHAEVSDYEENNSLVYTVQNQRASSFISSIGAKYEYKISTKESFILKATAGYDSAIGRAVISSQDTINNQTTTYGVKPKRALAQANVAYENYLAENAKISLNYGYFERFNNYKSQLVSANLKIGF